MTFSMMIATVLALWISLSGAAQGQTIDFDELLSKADAALAQEDYQTAVDAYQDVIRLNPNHARALHSLARLYASASDPEYFDGALAVELALMALDSSPDDPEIIHTLSLGYFAQNKFERAIAECLRAMELNMDETGYFRMLKKFATTWKAQLDMKNPNRDLPEKAKAAHMIGLACYHLGEMEAALEALERAYDSGLRDKDVCLTLARVRTATGDPMSAVALFQTLEEELSQDPMLLLELGRASRRAKNSEVAAACFEEAFSLNPDLEGLRKEMGSLYLEMKRYTKAAVVLKEGIEKVDRSRLHGDEEEGELYYLLGKALAGADEVEDGMDWIFNALSLKPDLEGAERDLVALFVQRFGSSKGLRKYLADRLVPGAPFFMETSHDSGLTHTGVPAFGDMDGDGDPDLLLSGQRLYMNDGKGRFKDVTEKMGLTDTKGSRGLFADVDNDGDLDIYVLIDQSGWQERLYRNEGRKGYVLFSEEGAVTGDLYPTQSAAMGDLNGDGYLDVYLANGGEVEGIQGKAHPDSILFNKGNGAFEEVTESSGIARLKPYPASGVCLGDYDNDGDLDIFVANTDLAPNRLLKNDGRGRFEEVAVPLGVAGNEHRGRYGNTGVGLFSDPDGDGDMDLFTTNRVEPRFARFADESLFFKSSGRPDFTFTPANRGTGLRFIPGSLQPLFADLNNDGNLDLIIAAQGEGQLTRVYLGGGGGVFTDITWLSGIEVEDALGCAVADIDQDGDLDLLAGGADRPHLYVNQGNKNHWIAIRLQGTGCNSTGIGARITLDYGTSRTIREVMGGGGVATQDSMVVHFGLGDFKDKVNILVQWPHGKSDYKPSLKTDRIHTIEE